MRTKVIDKSKCMGCKNCELACMAAKLKDAGDTGSAYARSMEGAIQPRNKVELDKQGNRFPQFCRHCKKPACVEACMSGALAKNEDGYVVCDTEKCVGCYMCVMSCPYGMARPGENGIKAMNKCDGCVGKDCMACVAACPAGCLSVIEDDKAVSFKK